MIQTCEAFNSLWVDFLENRLPPGQAFEMRMHIKDCAACRTEEARLRAVLVRLGSMPSRITNKDTEHLRLSSFRGRVAS